MVAVTIGNPNWKPGRSQLLQLSIPSLQTRSWKGGFASYCRISHCLTLWDSFPRGQLLGCQSRCHGALQSRGNSHTDTGRSLSKHCPSRDYAQATAPEPTASWKSQGKTAGAVRAERLKPSFTSKNLPCTTDWILSSVTYPCFIQSVVKDSTLHCFINSPILYEHTPKKHQNMYDFGYILYPRHYNIPRLLLQDKWSTVAPSLYKSPQFDMISASHVSWPLVDINGLPYDDIYGFHYFLQHSIDFEIYNTYMNCPSKLCHYSCLYNRWRHAQWFRIKCNQPSNCLRLKKWRYFSQLKFNFLKIIRILKF